MKAIRLVMEQARKGRIVTESMQREALAEVEAIEKAARVVVDAVDQKDTQKTWPEAVATLRSIAKGES